MYLILITSLQYIKINFKLLKINCELFAVISLSHHPLFLLCSKLEKLYLITICHECLRSLTVYKFTCQLIECCSFSTLARLKLFDILSVSSYLFLLYLEDFVFEPIANGFLHFLLLKQCNGFFLSLHRLCQTLPHKLNLEAQPLTLYFLIRAGSIPIYWLVVVVVVELRANSLTGKVGIEQCLYQSQN